MCTDVYKRQGQSLSTDGVGRDHALDSVGHGQIAVLSHQLAVLDLLQAAEDVYKRQVVQSFPTGTLLYWEQVY